MRPKTDLEAWMRHFNPFGSSSFFSFRLFCVTVFLSLLPVCPAVITGVWSIVFGLHAQERSVQVCVIVRNV